MARKLPVRPIAVENWPAADRDAWSRVCAGGGFLDEPGALSNIKEAQLVRTCRAYGSWLGHLADNEGLQSMESGVWTIVRQGFLRGIYTHLLETHLVSVHSPQLSVRSSHRSPCLAPRCGSHRVEGRNPACMPRCKTGQGQKSRARSV